MDFDYPCEFFGMCMVLLIGGINFLGKVSLVKILTEGRCNLLGKIIELPNQLTGYSS